MKSLGIQAVCIDDHLRMQWCVKEWPTVHTSPPCLVHSDLANWVDPFVAAYVVHCFPVASSVAMHFFR